MSGIGGCEAGGGELVARTFTGSCTMMMSTNSEDGTLASKLYQQHLQAAPPCSPSTSRWGWRNIDLDEFLRDQGRLFMVSQRNAARVIPWRSPVARSLSAHVLCSFAENLNP